MNDLIKVVFSFCALFFILITQQSYEAPWFEASATQIVNIQAGATDIARTLWSEYSAWGLTLVETLPIAIPYLFISERARCFYYVVMLMGIQGITSGQKLKYHQARPFWVYTEISAFNCSSQYGNPSGHCFTTLGGLLLVWLDYNSWAIDANSWVDDASSRTNPSMFTKWLWRLIIAVIFLVYSGAIAYSRMYLGVHSLN